MKSAATPSRSLPRDRRESHRCLRAGRVDWRAVSAVAWFATAETAGIALYLPTLALAEVLGHSMIVLGELDAASVRQVDQLLTDAGVFDAMAGHVVHVARQRRWPALSADPDRLRRLDPGIEIDLL